MAKTAYLWKVTEQVSRATIGCTESPGRLSHKVEYHVFRYPLETTPLLGQGLGDNQTYGTGVIWLIGTSLMLGGLHGAEQRSDSLYAYRSFGATGVEGGRWRMYLQLRGITRWENDSTRMNGLWTDKLPGAGPWILCFVCWRAHWWGSRCLHVLYSCIYVVLQFIVLPVISVGLAPYCS